MRRSLIYAVLATALLLGHTLGAAHDADHALKPGAAHACAVCIYSPGGAGLLPAPLQLDLDAAADAPECSGALSPAAAALRHHPIRGPPALAL